MLAAEAEFKAAVAAEFRPRRTDKAAELGRAMDRLRKARAAHWDWAGPGGEAAAGELLAARKAAEEAAAQIG